MGELTALFGEPQNLVSYHLARAARRGRWCRRGAVRPTAATPTTASTSPAAASCSCATGAALHPGLRLGLRAEHGRAQLGAPSAAGAVPVHRQQRPVPDGRGARSSDRTGRAVEARSAGSHPKPLHPNAVRVMAERGIDIAGRATKHLDRFARQRFDRVVTLCDKVREVCPEFPGDPTLPTGASPTRRRGRRRRRRPIRRSSGPPTSSTIRVGFLLARLAVRRPNRKEHRS